MRLLVLDFPALWSVLIGKRVRTDDLERNLIGWARDLWATVEELLAELTET